MLTGICKEEKSEISMMEDSTIKGFVEDNLISFIKTYPGDDLNKKLDVEYFGEFDEEKSTIFGKWIITEAFIDDNLDSNEFQGEGIWILKR